MLDDNAVDAGQTILSVKGYDSAGGRHHIEQNNYKNWNIDNNLNEYIV